MTVLSLNTRTASTVTWIFASPTRVIRAQVLSVKTREFVESARAVGGSPARLLLRHILPNAISPILVEATFGIAREIVAEAGVPSWGGRRSRRWRRWGSTIGEGRHFLFIAPHIATAPGAAILLTVMAFNFVGDGLRDALDVRVETG